MEDVLHNDSQEFSDSKKITMTSLTKKKNTCHKPITQWHHHHEDGHLQERPRHTMPEWPGHCRLLPAGTGKGQF